MIASAERSGLFKGLAENLVEHGVAILQYADDTILLIHDDVEGARNLKLLLYIFEIMSGLKINFEKSETMLILDDSVKLQEYVELFNCQKGKWPINYLGTHVCARRLPVLKYNLFWGVFFPCIVCPFVHIYIYIYKLHRRGFPYGTGVKKATIY
jgi:hypothetical protein